MVKCLRMRIQIAITDIPSSKTKEREVVCLLLSGLFGDRTFSGRWFGILPDNQWDHGVGTVFQGRQITKVTWCYSKVVHHAFEQHVVTVYEG